MPVLNIARTAKASVSSISQVMTVSPGRPAGMYFITLSQSIRTNFIPSGPPDVIYFIKSILSRYGAIAGHLHQSLKLGSHHLCLLLTEGQGGF